MILAKTNQIRTAERNQTAGSWSDTYSHGQAVSQDIFQEMHRFSRFNVGNRGGSDQATGWRLDKTGRQWLAQQTIWSLLNWLYASEPSLAEYKDHACRKAAMELGNSTTLKRRYVRLLLAGMTGDRATMKLLRPGLENKDLVQRIIMLDLFSLRYKADLQEIIAGIGSLAAEAGMADRPGDGISPVIEQEFITLMKWLNSTGDKGNHSGRNTDHVIRLWLIGLTVRALRKKTEIGQLISPTEA